MQGLAAAVTALTPAERAALARRLAGLRAPGDAGGTLVAYVVAQPGELAPAAADLRAYLASRLPAAMVPAHVMALPALPRTPNGKVDRAALPAPDTVRADDQGHTGFVAPRTPLESAIAAIWTKVLRVDRVSVEDHFFDVGGDSLLGMQVVALLRRAGHDVTPAQLIAAPTVAGLAAELERARTQAAALPAADALMPEAGARVAGPAVVGTEGAPGRPLPEGMYQLRAGTGRRPLFLVHDGGGGHQMAYAPIVAHIGGDHPVYGLIQADVRRDAPASLESLAAVYVNRIRQVQPDGPYVLGGYCLGGVLAYEMAQQLADCGERSSLVVLYDAVRPGYGGDSRAWATDAERAVGDLARGTALRRHVSARRAWLHRWYRYYRFRLLGELGMRWPSRLTPPDAVAREHRFLVNWRLQLAYRPRPHRGGPVCLLRTRRPFTAEDLGWDAVVPGGVRVDYVDRHGEGSTAFDTARAGRRTGALLEAHG